MRLARPLLPQVLPRRVAVRVHPDRPDRSGHSTDPTGPPVTVDTPGERSYVTDRGQVTTGIPTVGRVRPAPAPSAAPVPKSVTQ